MLPSVRIIYQLIKFNYWRVLRNRNIHKATNRNTFQHFAEGILLDICSNRLVTIQATYKKYTCLVIASAIYRRETQLFKTTFFELNHSVCVEFEDSSPILNIFFQVHFRARHSISKISLGSSVAIYSHNSAKKQ